MSLKRRLSTAEVPSPKRRKTMSQMSSLFSQGSNPDIMEVVGNPRGTKRPRTYSVKGGKRLTKRQKKQVSIMIHREQELKYFFFRQAATSVTSNAALTGAPFDVPQGDTDNTRDGDRLRWCGHIDLNMQIWNGQGVTGDPFTNTRVVVFQWHPTSTSAPIPSPTDVLITGPSTVVDIYSVYNHDTRQNYTILYDRVFLTVGSFYNGAAAVTPSTFLGPGTDTSSTGVHQIRIPLTKARKDVQYVAGGAQATNRIFIIWVSDSSFASHPQLAFMSKIVFRDS